MIELDEYKLLKSNYKNNSIDFKTYEEWLIWLVKNIEWLFKQWILWENNIDIEEDISEILSPQTHWKTPYSKINTMERIIDKIK